MIIDGITWVLKPDGLRLANGATVPAGMCFYNVLAFCRSLDDAQIAALASI